MNDTWWINPKQLDKDQRDIVQLKRDGSFLILGPPGSGKTNLLLLRAKYLSLADRPNVKILVFNRTLREFLAIGAKDYSFPISKIQTYNHWARNILSDHSIKVNEHSDFDTQRQNILDELNKLLKRGQIGILYDAVLLDEAHDYTHDEIEFIFKIAKNVTAVADPRQQIYRHGDSIDLIKSLVSETKQLKYHYRNGIKICNLADHIGKAFPGYDPMTPTSNYDENTRPSSVNSQKFDSIDEQCEQAVSTIATQMQAYPNEPIGVICPRHTDLDEIKVFLQNSTLAGNCTFQDSADGYVQFDPNRPICVSTIHSAKGLEFRALHMIACDSLRGFSRNRSVAFTGVTRAKTSLSIYYKDEIPGFLDSALKTLSPRGSLPVIDEAFGRSK